MYSDDGDVCHNDSYGDDDDDDNGSNVDAAQVMQT